MIAPVISEARDLPVMEPYHAHWRRVGEELLAAWPRAACCDSRLKAALALALGFDTWRLLVQGQGLSDKQAIELMLRLTCNGRHTGTPPRFSAPKKRASSSARAKRNIRRQ